MFTALSIFPIHPLKRTVAASLLLMAALFLSACIPNESDQDDNLTETDSSIEPNTIVIEEPSAPTPEIGVEAPANETPNANETLVTEKVAIESTNSDIKEKTENAFADPDSESKQPYADTVEKIISDKAPLDYQRPFTEAEKTQVNATCEKIANKLASVSLSACVNANLRSTSFQSALGTEIILTEFAEMAGRKPLGRVLVIGGTHGDELTSISIVFKWIEILEQYHSGLFHWHMVPVMNPDGALKSKATRQNANGIDLNRNMPTPDWQQNAAKHWKKTQRDPRKNPGSEPASEPEVHWLMHEIATFKPDAIISVHAPYGILDFDSTDLRNAPKSFGRLQLNLLGTYPGSLGNYAGINRSIPVLTLELPHAWEMPQPSEINSIWTDMIRWLKGQLSNEVSTIGATKENNSKG